MSKVNENQKKYKKYFVEGMSCAACVSHVEKCVRKIPGIKDVTVNLMTTEMYVYSDNINNSLENKIEKAVNDGGYKLVFERTQDLKKDNLKIKLIISCVLSVILFYLCMGHMLSLPLPGFLKTPYISATIQFVLALVVIILNFHYYKNGFKRLIKLSPNMDSLIAMGSFSSMVYGIYSIIMIYISTSNNDLVTLEKYAHNLYFDSAATILTLVSLGKYLEAKSKVKTLNAISELMKLSPKEAFIIVDGETKKVHTNEVQIDDVVLCKQGMKVPVDGIILSGNVLIDESNITGESMPVYKQAGDEIISSSVVLSGFTTYKATKVGDDTTINTIIRLVNEASNSKAKVSRVVDKVAGIFTFFVMGVSILCFAIHMLLNNGFEFSLNIAISILVVSCPCSLGLATPLAIMVGTGISAKAKILIKNAEVLENARMIDTVVFDKTGTLTKGKPVVFEYDLDCIEVAYNLERLSSHPIAYAINQKGLELELDKKEITEYQDIEGIGLSGIIDGKRYFVGNIRLLEKGFIEDIKEELVKSLEEEVNEKSKEGISTVLVFTENKYIGSIKLKDEIKDSSIDAVNALKNLNIKLVMLTGDKKGTSLKLNDQLNIDKVYSEVLPQDKQNIIKELKKEIKNKNGLIAMVGDGVNDAIALTQADVGISIGNATDIAIESSDIVLLNNDLMGIVNVINLSKKVMNTIKANLFWAFFYNCIGILLASGVLYESLGILLNPMICALAMSFSSLFVVGNSLLINRFKINNKKIDKGEKKMKVFVPTMACMHCVARIEEALKKVKKLEFNVCLEDKSVTFNTDDEKLIEKGIKAIEKGGYKVEK